MPIFLPKDTRDVLGAGVNQCDSRSLLFDRFPFFDRAVDEYRMASFCLFMKDGAEKLTALINTTQRNLNLEKNADKRQKLLNKLDALKSLLPRSTDSFKETRKTDGPVDLKIKAWRQWLEKSKENSLKMETLFAQLKSRLMVNMAVGVMENAGLCLDRFGVPYIPGSPIKSCARRMALQECLESENMNEKANLLSDIALAFGWGDTDWKPERILKRQNGQLTPAEPYSDFWWAMVIDSGDHSKDQLRNERWKVVAKLAATELLLRLRIQNRRHPEKPWLDLPNFAGSISFLPAYPWQLPAMDLELDVVTCHHPQYYGQEKDKNDKLIMPVALDSEQRILPIVFPAVKQSIIFQFALVPLRLVDSQSHPGQKLHQLARRWLSQGLETFGLGAKTAAGYGWFKEGTLSDLTRPTAPPATTTSAPSSSGSVSAETPPVAEHPLITQWRGKTQPGNFRAFRPLLAKLENTEELSRVFYAIIPSQELHRLRKNNPYWQSFQSHPEGQAILKRLGIALT